LNFETIARPYAQAIYDHSQGWEVDLEQLELALETPEVQMLIDSPKLAYKKKPKYFYLYLKVKSRTKQATLSGF
jgi:F0F1-type ATP synthase delta subunit